MLLQPNAGLRVLTSSAATTHVSYDFIDQRSVFRSDNRLITSSGFTTLFTTPATQGRELKTLVVRNSHVSISNTVTVAVFVNGNVFNLVSSVLGPGESLTYVQGQGFSTLTASGLLKTAQSLATQPAAVNTLNMVVLGNNVINSNATANTLQDITGMSFPVVSGGTYWFEATLLYRSAALTTGARFTVNGPAFSEFGAWQQASLTATTMGLANMSSYSQPAASFASVAATTGNIALIGGVLRATDNGVVQLQFASEVASSAVTVIAGSLLRWVQTL